jgi:abortive infection bacteriophage resistance protein
LPFKQPDGAYTHGLTFERVAGIYEFDQTLHMILFKAIGEIECSVKTAIAYYHAHKYGADGYYNPQNYNGKHRHPDFMRRLWGAVDSNRNMLFVKHHLNKYSGTFPIWVAVELFTMGSVSMFYADLKNPDKQTIAKTFQTDHKYLESWLHAVTVLRNISAHFGRIYGVSFDKNPLLPRHLTSNLNLDPNARTLFKQLCMLKLLYVNQADKWNRSILEPLSALVEEYRPHLDFRHIGFPDNWETVLRW